MLIDKIKEVFNKERADWKWRWKDVSKKDRKVLINRAAVALFVLGLILYAVFN